MFTEFPELDGGATASHEHCTTGFKHDRGNLYKTVKSMSDSVIHDTNSTESPSADSDESKVNEYPGKYSKLRFFEVKLYFPSIHVFYFNR